ncbi:hypothetical protein BA768_19470 [Chryseobacterium sp. CBo1]|uniref:hypothetical protein n=1 Tax=Chryseobacterium sp. CBo1 TaxID=1869230 RepID=UPI000810B2BD|nr:hypothetical protein [Chryseobacterium sp. CBo1]OCK50655.1 hypothetical protein BA768_19470 [Chryseobacterium sp. CBo1]
MSATALKLVPMIDFVIEYYSHEGYADLHTLNLMNNYANFLRLPLALNMFVPVDRSGNILKEPKSFDSWKSLAHNQIIDDEYQTELNEYKAYQKAKGKCLFGDFKVAYNGFSVVRIVASYDHNLELSFSKTENIFQGFNTVESLIRFDEIFLTKAVLKKIGLKI